MRSISRTDASTCHTTDPPPPHQRDHHAQYRNPMRGIHSKYKKFLLKKKKTDPIHPTQPFILTSNPPPPPPPKHNFYNCEDEFFEASSPVKEVSFQIMLPFFAIDSSIFAMYLIQNLKALELTFSLRYVCSKGNTCIKVKYDFL